jgi:hypothetical protein
VEEARQYPIVSDVVGLVAIALVAGVFGYFVYREVSRGEFRRMGMDGWHRREDYPRDYLFHVVCHSLILLMIVSAFVWTLLGKPKL